ncbi:hypothetical protein [Arenibaculum pallidiluteum]|uniref:hypothetical protein n=1 Tax=Arenibaculum pallidiluteum TaxID=2812559 RepID=UPI001A973A26|nr:hypothetical protein [Arenibaculum pallidiluteum]
MIYASILQPDGQHADFHSGPGARAEVRMENGVLVLHVRDGSGSVRVRISEPLLAEIVRAGGGLAPSAPGGEV